MISTLVIPGGLNAERIMLLIIKSAQEKDISPARLSYREERRVVESRYVQVDVKYSRPLETQYNRDTFHSINNFITEKP